MTSSGRLSLTRIDPATPKNRQCGQNHHDGVVASPYATQCRQNTGERATSSW